MHPLSKVVHSTWHLTGNMSIAVHPGILISMNIEALTPTKTEILNAIIFSMMYLDHQAETPAIDIKSNEYTSSGVRDSPDTTTSSIW